MQDKKVKKKISNLNRSEHKKANVQKEAKTPKAHHVVPHQEKTSGFRQQPSVQT